MKHAIWLNIRIMCKLNKSSSGILLTLFKNSIASFERTQDLHHKHLIMCQMLWASENLTRETAVDTLLKIFLNYSREDNIEFDSDFISSSFVFIKKVGFGNIKESAVPYFRCILIKPSQHLKGILCQGLKDLAFHDFHQEIVDFLFELSKDDQIVIQKEVTIKLVHSPNKILISHRLLIVSANFHS